MPSVIAVPVIEPSLIEPALIEPADAEPSLIDPVDIEVPSVAEAEPADADPPVSPPSSSSLPLSSLQAPMHVARASASTRGHARLGTSACSVSSVSSVGIVVRSSAALSPPNLPSGSGRE
ncbi:MAG: hypothetical protein K1X88_24905 [Nannocystaceae bacterium]|nr:hypothetical protein [Nannocystaceae bacterium]